MRNMIALCFRVPLAAYAAPLPAVSDEGACQSAIRGAAIGRVLDPLQAGWTGNTGRKTPVPFDLSRLDERQPLDLARACSVADSLSSPGTPPTDCLGRSFLSVCPRSGSCLA